MILNLLGSWTIGDEVVRQVIPQLIGLKTVTKNGVKFAGETLNKCSKLSLLVLAQFQIENCLRSLARDINICVYNLGFYKVAQKLLVELGIKRDRLEILNTPALLRNSLHKNGIHTGYGGKNTLFVIDGVKYEFLDGKRVQCATWEHTAHALEASINILDELFHTNKVLALPDPIIDQYVWELIGESDVDRER